MLTFTPSLHGLRGIAALAVLLFHWSDYFPGLTERLARVEFGGITWNLGMQLGFGWLGVHLFFVLSGYLLAAQLQGQTLHAPLVLRFWLRRFLRIYPGLWFQLLVLLLLSWLGLQLVAPFSLEQFWMNVLLWINLPPGMYRPINGVYWTLPIEVSFYLALPLLIWLQRRIGWVALWIGCMVLAVTWRSAVMATFPNEHLVARLPILDALPGSLASFMAGVAITNLGTNLRLGFRRSALAILALAFLALEYWLLANRDSYWTGHWMLAIWNPTMAVVIGLGVLLLLHPPPEFRWLGSRPMVVLGDLSYGIYLWHLPAMWLVRTTGGEALAGPIGSAYALAATVCITFAVAAVSYRMVEKPMIEWGRQLTAAGSRFGAAVAQSSKPS